MNDALVASLDYALRLLPFLAGGLLIGLVISAVILYGRQILDALRPERLEPEAECPDCYGVGFDGSGAPCHCLHTPAS